MSEERKTTTTIVNEFQQLGQHLASLTKAVLESPEAQEAAAQVRKGLESLEKTVSQLASQARETKVGQKVEEGVSGATATLKEKRVLETLSETVASALHTLNETLGQTVEKVEKRAEAEAETPQQIEVVQDEQAEGEDTTSEE